MANASPKACLCCQNQNLLMLLPSLLDAKPLTMMYVENVQKQMNSEMCARLYIFVSEPR